MNRTALLLVIASVGSITAFACGGSSPSDPGSGVGDADAGVDASLDGNGGAVPPPQYTDAAPDSHAKDGGAKVPDASPDTGGGTACAPGTKSCGDRCVPVVDPATGCAATDCTPCSFKNAGATCNSAGACAMGACAAHFSDCNTDAKDGCEVDTTTADHCGTCTTACSSSAPNCAPSGATYACSTGCPASASTLCGAQCVDLATSASHCGSCTNDCGTIDNGQMTCAANQCVAACSAGFHACGATCAASTAAATCGTSCTPCAEPPANGHATCDGVSCGIQCDNGFHDCGGQCVANNDVNNCGTACGVACGGATNASPTCNGTSCGYACSAGFTDCNSAAGDGCEAHLADDANNCGACGHSCQGGACSAGQCQPVVLASARFNPTRTYVFGTSLYYTTTGNGEVYTGSIEAVPLTGGAAPLVISDSGSNPDALSLVGNELYWLNGGGFLIGNGDIRHCPVSVPGCGTGSLYMSLGAQANDMILFGTTLYVAQKTFGSTPSNIFSTASSAAIATAQATTEQFTQIVADGASIYWTDSSSGAFGAVYKCKPATCASSLTQVATGQSGPYGIALDSNFVYWTSVGDGSINRCSLTATSPCNASAARLVAGEHTPYHLAVDGSGIYWANHDDGTIRKLPLAGGTPVTIATGQTNAQGISLDASTVYWANHNGSVNFQPPTGSVMKVAK